MLEQIRARALALGFLTVYLSPALAGAHGPHIGSSANQTSARATVESVLGQPDPKFSSFQLNWPGKGHGTTVTADAVSAYVATVKLHDVHDVRILGSGGQIRITSSIGVVGPVTDNHDGSYSAKITSMAPGKAVVRVSVTNSAVNRGRQAAVAGRGVLQQFIGGNVAATFAPPAATSSSDFMAAWTVATCTDSTDCTYEGIYEDSVADPGSGVTEAVSGELMGGTYYAAPAVAVEGATLDTSTGNVTQLGGRELVYAQSGAIFSLDLTTRDAMPAKLSTLAPTVVCYLGGLSPYGIEYGTLGSTSIGEPTWIFVAGFTGAGNIQSDCQSGSPTTWLIPADGDVSSVPLTVGANAAVQDVLGALMDPASGQVSGLLALVNGDLVLLSNDLSQQTTLKSGFVPNSDGIELMSPGLHSRVLLDVYSVSGGTRHDNLYWANAGGVSPAVDLSIDTAGSYFADCAGNPAGFTLATAEDLNDTLYFLYPTDSGFEIEALADGGISPRTVYVENGAYLCDGNEGGGFQAVIWPTSSGALLMTENDATGALWRIISLSASGPSNQVPAVLTAESNGSLLNYYYSTTADTLWISDHHCNDSNCDTDTRNIVAMHSDGTGLMSFPGMTMGGDAQQGFNIHSGDLLRSDVALTALGGDPCTATGWTLYDATTLTSITNPDFTGGCVNGVSFFGDNDQYFFGSVPDGAGGGVTAYGLFGQGTNIITLGHFSLPGGAVSVKAVGLD